MFHWLWHLRVVRVPLVVLAGLAVGLRLTPQARDVLVTLGQSDSLSVWALFIASLLWLGVNAWFWSRFALDTQARAPASRLAAWLPPMLGALPFLGVAFAMLGAATAIPPGMRAMMGAGGSGTSRLTVAATLIAGLGLCFPLGLAGLSRWTMKRRGAGSERGSVGPGGAALLALTGAAAIAGMVLYGVDPVGAGRMLQPAPTILLAAAGLLCGGTAITWLGARAGVPILAILLLLAFGLAELRDADWIADNHDIRLLAGAPSPRDDIDTGFARFLRASEAAYPAPRPVPVVLVATGGGGIAAAFWTATVLGDLADQVPGFADQLFAISGVSGGSLGALTAVALLHEPAQRRDCGGARHCAQTILAGDFLAPTLGRLLYSDLMQRFLPVPVFEDRATALEQAWESSWRSVRRDDRLGGAFLDLWAADHPWPALLLNGTSVATGGRIVTSNLRLAGASPEMSVDAADLLALAGADVRASTAADNSARFPYIGPVGTLRRDGEIVDLVADGGYFENFGATTLLDTLDALDEAARRAGRAVRFIVIQISSDPDLTVAPDRMRRGWLLPRGLSGPVVALLRSRFARGATATAALARRTAALGGLYVPVRLGFSPTGASAPLGWSLSAVARHVIDAQWTPACRERLAAAMALAAAPARAPGDFMTMLQRPACAAQR